MDKEERKITQKKIFFGAAIQGSQKRDERAKRHQFIINSIKKKGFSVVTEHTTGKTYEESIAKLQQAIGPLPPPGIERRIFVRNAMINAVEGDITAAIFEVSVPSLGTGIELAHAYLRPRMNLPKIPVLALYEKDFWPNKLSTMIQGISTANIPQFSLMEYSEERDLESTISSFLCTLQKPSEL